MSEVLSTETKFTRHLDDDELDTILIIAKNEQSGRITPFEVKELVRVYRATPDLYEALYVITLQYPYSDDQLEAIDADRDDDGPISRHWARKMLAARAALAKARGETSLAQAEAEDASE